MTEAELLAGVLEVARLLGWRAAHFRPARTSHGWRTAMQGDAGFPDLCLVRERVVFVELKVGRNRLTAEQEAWRSAIEAAGVEFYVWREADWATGVVEVLLGPSDIPRGRGSREDSQPPAPPVVGIREKNSGAPSPGGKEPAA